MPLTPLRVRSSFRTLARAMPPRNALLDSGRRRHLALLSVVLLVSFFGYAMLEPRKVRVQADGHEIVIETRASSDSALLSVAGVSLRPGDRVTSLEGDGADVLRIDRARDVTILVDDETYVVRTHARTIDQLLSEADIAINARDSVLQNNILVSMTAPVDPPHLFATRALSRDEALTDAIEIEVRRAVPFVIAEDGREVESTSSRPTVAQVLREAGIVIGPGDSITPEPQSAIDAGTRIDVRHARPVTVALPDGHQVLYTLANTVGDALAAAGISLPAGGFVDPPEETLVTAGMSVRVVQLSASSDYEREFIESHTVFKADASLAPGQIRTVQGHDGARIRRYSVSYVDGVEAGRELTEERFSPEVVDTVIYYPTRTGQNESQPADSGSVRKNLRVYATWYNPASSGRAASDPAYGRTANGSVVTYGIVAVDPAVIPLGTKLFIPGYGYAVAADTGGAVQGYIIDLGYPDGVSVDWQSKWVDIYVLS